MILMNIFLREYPVDDTPTGGGFAKSNSYRFPGFFVNNKLLSDGNHNNMEHIFLPASLSFLKIANDAIEADDAIRWSTLSRFSRSPQIPATSGLFNGNFTYQFGDGTEITDANEIHSQILISRGRR